MQKPSVSIRHLKPVRFTSNKVICCKHDHAHSIVVISILFICVICSKSLRLAREHSGMLGIDKPCPTNVRFLIKNLKMLDFQNNTSVKVRLNPKILIMLGYPKSCVLILVFKTPRLPQMSIDTQRDWLYRFGKAVDCARSRLGSRHNCCSYITPYITMCLSCCSAARIQDIPQNSRAGSRLLCRPRHHRSHPRRYLKPLRP